MKQRNFVVFKIEPNGSVCKSSFSCPHAFTLVELLSTIAIIAILITMLLPAVQMMREAGQRTACSNNVRQLALGLMNFESSHGQLPMGLRTFDLTAGSGGGSTANQYYGMSWITRILPFIEQNAMWENTIEDYRYSPMLA